MHSEDFSRIQTWILRAIPKKHREHLAGDLLEEYRNRSSIPQGEAGAKKWLRREMLRCVLSNLSARLLGFLRGFGEAISKRECPRSPRGFLDPLTRDLRYATRSLRRSGSTGMLAVATLAVGIGANTAIFSVVDGVVFKPLPFHEPHRLMILRGTHARRDGGFTRVSYPNLTEVEKRSRVLAGLAGAHVTTHVLSGADFQDRLIGGRATASFFRVLGVRPAQGRPFHPEDDLEGAADVAIVSSGFWRRYFGDRTLVGTETITLDDRAHTVVGVLPEGFEYPPLSSAEVWTPAALDFQSFTNRAREQLLPVARLTEGVSITEAQADLDRVAREMEEAFPDTNRERGFRVDSLMRLTSSVEAKTLFLLLGAVELVLLVACLNVANLLLVRGVGRRRELAVRTALGAGRARVVSQLMTEGLLLSAAGGALGVLSALAGTRVLVGILPTYFARTDNIAVDLRTLCFAVSVSILTCLLAGLWPTIRASRTDVIANLKDGEGATSGRARRRAQHLLVIGEVAVALVVLVGSGLLVRTIQNLNSVDPGWDPESVLGFRMQRRGIEAAEAGRARLYTEVLGEITRLPGVVSAGATTGGPVGWGPTYTVQEVGQAEIPEEERIRVLLNAVTPGYFETLGIPLVAGASLSVGTEPAGPGIALVNESAARRFRQDGNVLGKRIRIDLDAIPAPVEIIGIVGDTRNDGLDADPTPKVFLPHTQRPMSYMNWVVRAEGDREVLIAAIRRIVFELAQEGAFDFQELKDRMALLTEDRLFATRVMGLFGVLSLVLVVVGIFAVLSHAVSQRTRELGLRRVLGAEEPRLYAMVTRESLKLVALGGGFGIGGSFFANRLIASLLFGVTVTDFTTYLVVAGSIVLSAVVASVIPAARAARVDPLVALKTE